MSNQRHRSSPANIESNVHLKIWTLHVCGILCGFFQKPMSHVSRSRTKFDRTRARTKLPIKRTFMPCTKSQLSVAHHLYRLRAHACACATGTGQHLHKIKLNHGGSEWAHIVCSTVLLRCVRGWINRCRRLRLESPRLLNTFTAAWQHGRWSHDRGWWWWRWRNWLLRQTSCKSVYSCSHLMKMKRTSQLCKKNYKLIFGMHSSLNELITCVFVYLRC